MGITTHSTVVNTWASELAGLEPPRMTQTLCPVIWSSMRYSPGEDLSNFSIRALAAAKLSTAPSQSTWPSGSVLKISRGRNITDYLAFCEEHFPPILHHPVCPIQDTGISLQKPRWLRKTRVSTIGQKPGFAGTTMRLAGN